MDFLRQRTVASSVVILLLATFAYALSMESTPRVKRQKPSRLEYTYKGFTLEA